MLTKEDVRRFIYGTGNGLRALYCSLIPDAIGSSPKSMTGTCPFCNRKTLNFGVTRDWWKCKASPTCTPDKMGKNIFDLIIRIGELQGESYSFGWALAAAVNQLRIFGYKVPAELDEEMVRLGQNPKAITQRHPLPASAMLPLPPTKLRKKPATDAMAPAISIDHQIVAKLAAQPYSTRHLRDLLKRGRPEVMDAIERLAWVGIIVRAPVRDRLGRRNNGGGLWVLTVAPPQPQTLPQPQMLPQPFHQPITQAFAQPPSLAQVLPQPDLLEQPEVLPESVSVSEAPRAWSPRFGE